MLQKIASKCYLNGKWLSNIDFGVNTFKDINPYGGKVFAKFPDINREVYPYFSEAVVLGFAETRAISAKERSMMLQRIGEMISKDKEVLANIITSETGKCIKQSKLEVGAVDDTFRWFAGECERINGAVFHSFNGPYENLMTKMQPVGPVALITPWNFPLSMVARSFGAAFAAGCSVLLKPSEESPATALALADIMDRVGIPKGSFNVMTCSRENVDEIGWAICKDINISKISFTGSTKVGKTLIQDSAKQVKKLSMEMGGNAPFIVFPTANIEKSVQDLIAAKMRNCGQVCIAPNRIFLHKDIYDTFVTQLVEKLEMLKYGEPIDENVDVGCLVFKLIEACKNTRDVISITNSNQSFSRDLCFIPPTLILDSKHGDPISQTEIFGPVFNIIKFENEDEVIRWSNDTLYGLAGYAYSEDYRQIQRLSEALDVGMCGINSIAVSKYLTPFGGMKQSGIGRESSHCGIYNYLETKSIIYG